MFALLALWPGAAHADPARPGNYRSVVTRVDPVTAVIDVRVVGGDGFLALDVDAGHRVDVPGYDGEPWVRIDADGTVEQNIHSPATYLNSNRYADVTVPASVGATAPPEWKVVAHGGHYAWHDHRIHWMSPVPPVDKHPGDVIFADWQVPLMVDGRPATVHGTLTWVPPISPPIWFGAAGLICVLVVLIGKGKSLPVAMVAGAAVAVVTLPVGIVAWASIPAAAGPNPLELAFPCAALLPVVLALRRTWRVVGVIVCAGALGGWAFMRNAVLRYPVLPTQAPFLIDRVATTLACGTAIAIAILAVRSGGPLPTLHRKPPQATAKATSDDRGVTAG